MDTATPIFAQDPCSMSKKIADNDKVVMVGRMIFMRDLYI